MVSFLNSLEMVLPITWLRSSLLGYAFLNAAHVLFLGLFMGAVTLLDLGVLRAPGFAWCAPVLAPLRRMAITTFSCTALTGLLLFTVRPTDYLGNDAFLAKLAVLLLAGANAVLFQFVLTLPVRRMQALLSLILWLSVLLAGRLIGFM